MIAALLYPQVSASDRDSGVFGEVRYQVFPEDGIFFVEPVTGLVVAEGELDRETQDSYLITIVARDGGERLRVWQLCSLVW